MGAKRVTLKDFVERSNNIHHNKYNYDKVEWINTRQPVKIICPIHGEFTQKPYKHLQGQGCPKCMPNATVTQENFIARAKEMHPNDNYDYSLVDYKDMWTPVKIICPIHGEFEQTPAKHIKTGKSGCQGCPKCRYIKQRKTIKHRYGVSNLMQKKEFVESNWKSKKKNGTCNSSQPENRMYQELKDFFGDEDVLRNDFSDKRYPFACDFYIKSLDLFIELNGTWFHGCHWFDKNNIKDIEKLKLWQIKASEGHRAYGQAITIWTERDPLKLKTAKENKLNYLVFWDNDLKDFHNWLENYKNTKNLNIK